MSGYEDGFKRGTNYNYRSRMANRGLVQAAMLATANQAARCARGEHDETVADPKQVTYLAFGKRIEPGTRYCSYCSVILPYSGHDVARLTTADLRQALAGEPDAGVAEQIRDELTTRYRVRETGRRYGLLDARAGRSAPSCQLDPARGDAAEDWQAGWAEGYNGYLAPLRAQGARVAVPGHGGLVAAVTTGNFQDDDPAGLRVEVVHDGGPQWVPVPDVLVKE